LGAGNDASTIPYDFDFTGKSVGILQSSLDGKPLTQSAEEHWNKEPDAVSKELQEMHDGRNGEQDYENGCCNLGGRIFVEIVELGLFGCHIDSLKQGRGRRGEKAKKL
jgi:hypothetical protein